jgi:hypothetical protein
MQIFMFVLEQGFSFHEFFTSCAQVAQDGGREVHDSCMVVNHGPVYEEYAGNGFGINDVIAAPAPGIVLK